MGSVSSIAAASPRGLPGLIWCVTSVIPRIALMCVSADPCPGDLYTAALAASASVDLCLDDYAAPDPAPNSFAAATCFIHGEATLPEGTGTPYLAKRLLA
jgi:hypothetical protein